MTGAVHEEIRAAIPIDFFQDPNLTIFNGETYGLKGGAFRLRAVGSDRDGNPRRSKGCLFFGNGMFSMTGIDKNTLDIFHRDGIWGFAFAFTKKPNVKNGGFHWEAKSVVGDMGLRRNVHMPRLKIGREKPSEDEGGEILAYVEDAVSQYIFIE
jgi:hypothetical protein